MKSLLLLFILSLSLLTACEKKKPSKESKIIPVSSSETRAILQNLRLGHPVDDVLAMDDSCKAFMATLPESFFKGFVTVPEDYDNPRARQIKVFYYGRLEKDKDPIVFFNGGPASDSHSSSELLEDLTVFNPDVVAIMVTGYANQATPLMAMPISEPTPCTPMIRPSAEAPDKRVLASTGSATCMVPPTTKAHRPQ